VNQQLWNSASQIEAFSSPGDLMRITRWGSLVNSFFLTMGLPARGTYRGQIVFVLA
jgi:hypothetical protein